MASETKFLSDLADECEKYGGEYGKGRATGIRETLASLTAATARAEMLDAELLRVRTTGHEAAHELDNIAVECGLSHSPKPGDVSAHVRVMKTLYAKAWEECKEWRRRYDAAQRKGPPGIPFGLLNRIEQEQAHDAARKAVGLCEIEEITLPEAVVCDMNQKNMGHGHVYARPDKLLARCGGPGICAECSLDQARKAAEATRERGNG